MNAFAPDLAFARSDRCTCSSSVNTLAPGAALELPVLPLRDLVIFPGTVQPFPISAGRSMRAIRGIEQEGDLVVLATQRNPDVEEPTWPT